MTDDTAKPDDFSACRCCGNYRNGKCQWNLPEDKDCIYWRQVSVVDVIL